MVEEKYKTLEVVEKNPKSGVFHLYLNRPRQRNALTHDFCTEFPKALYALDHNRDVNVIVLSGAGDHFCSGIDISQLKSITQSYHDAGESLRRQILAMQDSVTALERCRKPVIASTHGACIGGAIDIVTACDLRYCMEEAFFSVKEVDGHSTHTVSIVIEREREEGGGDDSGSGREREHVIFFTFIAVISYRPEFILDEAVFFVFLLSSTERKPFSYGQDSSADSLEQMNKNFFRGRAASTFERIWIAAAVAVAIVGGSAVVDRDAS
ncbi:Enoyl-CoA hydratase/delta3,5-delta2,4-dienoyl-CoA isomerase [Arachis hypogaea]|uniref:Delta(3,5)-Delta(2,4)-dienoyl-CoA isomerase n=1 Tax=Arachis hypogaea TaxID=3818 RepID=A0A445BWZ2_ARAHY|nr:Enoyl-CoA hydratase/delta3,5-delta2,4-dienoyl-CoA isomerase [Arachis hypogaea]RYR43081.1 hypothetical protein Ahy_A08g039509 [Arachis hypogaea]